MILPQFYTDDIIKRSILEDINYVDVASDYLISEEQRDEAYFVSKADGVLCGIDVAMRVFELLDDSFTAKVYMHDGDKVKKGDKICEIDTKDIEYQIAMKELDRKRAFLYTEVLYDNGATQSEYDRAYVDVEKLDIELQKLYDQRDGAVLTAPASGTVSALADVRVGDYANPGQTIATIMQTKNLYIAIKPNDCTEFTIGRKVQIRLDEDYYEGEVFMNPDELADYMEKQNESHDKLEQGGIDYEAEMVYVRFTEDPPSDAVGQLADTILVLDTAENAICVSNNLIKTVDGEKVVYVLKDGEKTAVPVEIGLQTGSQSEITSGINEGDELVIR